MLPFHLAFAEPSPLRRAWQATPRNRGGQLLSSLLVDPGPATIEDPPSKKIDLHLLRTCIRAQSSGHDPAVTMRASLALFKRSAWKGMSLCQQCAFSPSHLRRTFVNRQLTQYTGPNVVPFDNLRPAGAGKTPPIIKTQARAASILPAFVGLRFAVHNGKTYQEVYITEEMVGRKLGEFVP